MIQKLLEGRALAEGEAERLMHRIMSGEATEAQIGAILVLLRQRGESVEEIVGFARAMRERAVPVTPPPGVLVDTCGTGGDGAGTFNVSTLAALVVAAAGVRVAKHGNRAASSRVGSADLLEALGVQLSMSPAAWSECLHRTDFAFFHAPLHHPAMKHAAAPRRQLGVRTVFNLLGPLTNPAGATHQLLGVSNHEWVALLAEVLLRLGCQGALVVHGDDGLDEISPAGPTTGMVLRKGRLASFRWFPEDAGLPRHGLETIRGGDLERNVTIARDVLAGEAGACSDAVALNAGAALFLSGAAKDLWEGTQEALRLLQRGMVQKKLEEIVAFTGTRRGHS